MSTHGARRGRATRGASTLLVVLAAAAAACGGGRARYFHPSDGDGGGDGGTDGGAGTDADADGGRDADEDADREADAEGEAPITPSRGAVVVLAEVDDGRSPVEASARIWFRLRRPMTWCGYRFGFYGDCTTFESNPPICDPACAEGTEACEWNEGCSAASCAPARDPAELFDAGAVSVAGAAHQPSISCLPSEDGGYACDVDPAEDLFEPGDDLTVSAPGLTFPAFSATVEAPSRIEVLTDAGAWTAETFDGSAPVLLEWDAAEPAAAVEISVATEGASLSCLARDVGSFTLPTEALAALDEGGDLRVTVTRSNAGIANEAGDGEVKVYAETVGLEVTIGR